jgi:hypothetical protein
MNWSRKRRPKAFRKVCIGTTEEKCKHKVDTSIDYFIEVKKGKRSFRCRKCHEDQTRRMVRGIGDNDKGLDE